MIKIYLKTAFRRLSRQKTFTIINITGLAIGVAVCMVIFVIIQYHKGFDEFHSKKARIYRVLTEYHHAIAAGLSYSKDVPFPLPSGLKMGFPQIEQVAPIFASHDDKILVVDEKSNEIKAFKEIKGVFFTDPSFFKMFDFPLLTGSFESLKEPGNVFLTKDIADRYFGNWKNAMGKTIKLEVGGYIFEHGTEVLKVSGILANIPVRSDFQLKLVVAYGTGFTGSLIAQSTDWQDRTNTGFGCFVLLPSHTTAESINKQLSNYSKEMQVPENKDNHLLQSLAEVHYDTQTGNYSNQSISHELLHVLWLIAGFIVLIACVNFVNLSTAQSVNRAKEIGVRKVLGSKKSQLQFQFLIETYLIVLGAIVLSIGITFFSIPFINRLLDLSISFNSIADPLFLIFLMGLTFVVTILAGFYPAIILSGFNPVTALKSKLSVNSLKGLSLRKGLVVFQFIIAQALIIATLVIVKQMDYFMNQPLGFDKEAVITVPFRVDTVWFNRADYLTHQLLSVNGVKSVSFSSHTPIEESDDIWSTFKFDHAREEADFKVITKFADHEYVPTYHLQLIAGRNLKASTFTQEFLINESLMKSLGIKNPDDILNKEISIWGDRIKCPIVGVLKDFNNRSFRNRLAPMLISTNHTMYSEASLKLDTKNMISTLDDVKKVWEQTLPNFVYEYRFLDDKIAGFYKQQSQLAQLYKLFSLIAILLSCLGLYGLASFMAVQRVKEIGIRKVLGASVGQLVYKFSREFVILVIIAFAIGVPLALFFMQQWLQNYAYRTHIGWKLVVVSGILSLIIALSTISFQAIKAANANPVNSLGSE